MTRGYCGICAESASGCRRAEVRDHGAAPAYIVHRTFPPALDAEEQVMDPGDATDSEKACVAWLAGGVSMATTEYLAFADGAERAVAVRNAEAAQHAGARPSSSNIGKVLRSRDLVLRTNAVATLRIPIQGR